MPKKTSANLDQRSVDPESWVDRHGDCLYRYALVRSRAPDLAADAVQETFLHALHAREDFAGRSSERTWLVGILRHKIIDHHRKAMREKALRHDPLRVNPRDSTFDRRGHWKNAPLDWGGDPTRALENREFWEAFEGCLAKLPSGVADAFFLRELDGLDAEEVRESLGITPENLWTRLHRARSLLRDCLESVWFRRSEFPVAAKGWPADEPARKDFARSQSPVSRGEPTRLGIARSRTRRIRKTRPQIPSLHMRRLPTLSNTT